LNFPDSSPDTSGPLFYFVLLTSYFPTSNTVSRNSGDLFSKKIVNKNQNSLHLPLVFKRVETLHLQLLRKRGMPLLRFFILAYKDPEYGIQDREAVPEIESIFL
jgi:hypothetical protein